MQSRLLNINPLVAIFDDVFDEEIAQAAIEAGKDRLERPTYGTSEGRIVGEKRTNLAALIDQWSHPQLTELMTRISSLVRMPPEHAETCKLLRYEGEQLFDVHFDGYDKDGPDAEVYARGGQRLFTTLSYLNDVPEDGQTAFFCSRTPAMAPPRSTPIPRTSGLAPAKAKNGFSPCGGENTISIFLANIPRKKVISKNFRVSDN